MHLMHKTSNFQEPELERWSSSTSELKRRREAVWNNSSRSVEDVRKHSRDVTLVSVSMNHAISYSAVPILSEDIPNPIL